MYTLGNYCCYSSPLGDVLDLFLNSCIKLIICEILIQVSKIRSDLLAVPEWNTVVQYQFDTDRPLRVSSGSPLIQSSCLLRFYASHQAVVSRIFDGNALCQHHLDVSIVEVACRESHTGTNYVYDLLHVFLRRFVVDTTSQGWLIDLYVPYSIHQQISQFIRGISAVTSQTAYAHVYERLISCEELGTAFTCDPHHFGHLDQHTSSQFKCLEVVHASSVQISLVVRVHVLVNTTDGHTSLVFFYRQQGLDGPYSLDRFPESIRFVSRYLGIDFRDLQQFFFSLRICFLCSQLSSILRHTACISHNTFCRVNNGFIEIDLVQIIRVFVVQHCQVFLGFVLDVEHALLHQDHVISGVGVSTAVYCVVRTVGNEGFAGQFPYAGFTILAFAVFVNGFAFPEREQFISHDSLVFIRDVERILRTAADSVDFIHHPSPCDIRRKCSCTRCAVRCSDDQFVVLDHQRSCFTAVTEALCTKFDLRHTRVLLGDLRYRTRSVSRNGRNLL